VPSNQRLVCKHSTRETGIVMDREREGETERKRKRER